MGSLIILRALLTLNLQTAALGFGFGDPKVIADISQESLPAVRTSECQPADDLYIRNEVDRIDSAGSQYAYYHFFGRDIGDCYTRSLFIFKVQNSDGKVASYLRRDRFPNGVDESGQPRFEYRSDIYSWHDSQSQGVSKIDPRVSVFNFGKDRKQREAKKRFFKEYPVNSMDRRLSSVPYEKALSELQRHDSRMADELVLLHLLADSKTERNVVPPMNSEFSAIMEEILAAGESD